MNIEAEKRPFEKDNHLNLEPKLDFSAISHFLGLVVNIVLFLRRFLCVHPNVLSQISLASTISISEFSTEAFSNKKTTGKIALEVQSHQSPIFTGWFPSFRIFHSKLYHHPKGITNFSNGGVLTSRDTLFRHPPWVIL